MKPIKSFHIGDWGQACAGGGEIDVHGLDDAELIVLVDEGLVDDGGHADVCKEVIVLDCNVMINPLIRGQPSGKFDIVVHTNTVSQLHPSYDWTNDQARLIGVHYIAKLKATVFEGPVAQSSQ